MPGFISPLSAASDGAVAGMKRAFAAEAVPTYGEPHPKRRKVVHKLHHTQPVHLVVEPIGGGYGAADDKEFFDHQLRRAIAVQCKGTGFDSARPEVLEEFRGLVDGYMTNFLAQVRTSMSSARRTETIPQDWIHALTSVGLTGSGPLEQHFDTGSVPPIILQPALLPPRPNTPPPPDLDPLLGPELSGKADKENRRYIPSHFPPFPSKHTYKATPVFAQRETDPRNIREKAAEEGIQAEASLRKLMEKQKEGLQNRKGGKRKRSQRMKESHALWKTCMEEALREEAERDEQEKQRDALQHDDEDDDEDPDTERAKSPQRPERTVNLEEGVSVNYDRKFWRQSARGV